MWSQIRTWLRREKKRSAPPPAAQAPLRLVSDNTAIPAPSRGDWEHRMEFRHQGVDWVFIPYSTLEDFDAAVAAHRTRIMDLQPPATPAISAIPSPCLPPQDAARRFLRWLRSEGRCGKYTDVQLRDAYAEHCTAMHIQPSAESQMRKHLWEIGRGNGVEKALGKGNNRSRRERPTVWIISPSLAQVVEQRRLAA